MSKKTAMKKILVVDDEEDILWSLKEFLVNKELQAQVITASSGEEALEKLARENIDLVITDIKMPGMSGLDLLVEIKNRFPYTSVIIMTAFPSSEFKREAMLKGGMHFLEKPFDIKDLRGKVMSVLEESQQFRGMLTGISLSDVIQIKCMSGVTAALRVTEGDRQGIIFFHKGEIIHAMCDEREGEEAFFEIVSFAQGHLDTVKIAELPSRTIFQPYVSLLMEGARRLDEQSLSGGAEGGKAAGEEMPRQERAAAATRDVAAGGDRATVDQGALAAAPMAEMLKGFKEIKGYRAAAILKFDGEIMAQDSISNNIDLRMVGATLNEFFSTTREASSKIGLETCHEAVLGTRSETLIMGCGGGKSGVDSLVLAVFGSDGNQALGRREMRKVVGRLSKG